MRFVLFVILAVFVCSSHSYSLIVNEYVIEKVSRFFQRYFLGNYNEAAEEIDDTDELKHESFDFIVVGSGPSGSVIANRLSEVPDWNVLLIEAGIEASPIVDVPLITALPQYLGYDWGYKAEQEDTFCRGCTEKRLLYPHGKVLGGTSVINFMIQVRGNPLDYDRWAAMGNPGWSYKDVLPYFLKSEDAHIKIQDEGYHNQGGHLVVSDVSHRTESVRAYIQAAQEAGHSYVDYNGKGQLGVSYVQTTTLNGRRFCAEKAYLRPVRHRKNLKIITKSRVTKILINPKTKRAHGVSYFRNNRNRIAIATKEVILCAGGLNSPQLLMLSGIGPRDHLEELGIPVLKDLPVGEKMYDHSTFPAIVFQLNDKIVNDARSLLDINTYLDYFLFNRGILTTIGGVESLTYIRTNVSDDPDPSYPDIELIYVGGSFNTDYGILFRKMFNIPWDVYDRIWKPLEGKFAYQVLPMMVHPKSHGRIRLRSKNPYDHPKFYAGFYSDPKNHDVRTIIAAIREIQRINSFPPLQKYGATMVRTFIPGCESYTFDTDKYWECGIRTLTGTFYHQVATCKMGPLHDKEAVVDANLKVHGIKSLRVVDTSVIPLPPTAHTAGPSYMIGEKASDIIKEEWGHKSFS